MATFNESPTAKDGLEKEMGFTAESADLDHGSIDEIKRTRELQSNIGILRVLRRSEEWLDSKMGIELRGVDRIPEEEKEPPSMWNIFLIWWSLNVHVGVVPLGLLGPAFGLSLNQAVASAIIGILLGAMCTGYCGTLGPKLGLRAIATSRYSFGFWGAKLCSVLNVVIGAGFAVVNFVVVGEILSAVSDYTMTITVGIVIIAILSYIISVFGFRIIHTFEKYSWIITFILMLVLIGQTAKYVDPSLPGVDTGLGYYGSFLTIISINFSNASGWCSIASDYYCNYPAKTNPWKIFFLTWAGIVIPTTFSVVVGTLLGNIAIAPTLQSTPVPADIVPFVNAYTDHGLGGLIYTSYYPNAFAKFCLIVFTFSVLGNNIAIAYSSGLSIQLLGHYFHAVPRFLWSLLVIIIIAVLAIAGQQSLANIVNDFVSLLGYWTVSFTFILLIEDKYFRRHDKYNLTTWDDPRGLPWGIAAVFSLLAAYLGGGVPGMSQTWYIGPIAAKFGPYGGDVGIWLSGAITLLVYPITRTIEKKYTGR